MRKRWRFCGLASVVSLKHKHHIYSNYIDWCAGAWCDSASGFSHWQPSYCGQPWVCCLPLMLLPVVAASLLRMVFVWRSYQSSTCSWCTHTHAISTTATQCWCLSLVVCFGDVSLSRMWLHALSQSLADVSTTCVFVTSISCLQHIRYKLATFAYRALSGEALDCLADECTALSVWRFLQYVLFLMCWWIVAVLVVFVRHGTRCAGEVAAQANNGICSAGVAFDAGIGGLLAILCYVDKLAFSLFVVITIPFVMLTGCSDSQPSKS